MIKYDFDSSINRRDSYSHRWNVKDGELPLNIADMDFDVLPEIKDAIKKRSEIGAYGYTFAPNSYFDAYINWWNKRHQTLLKREWFCFSSSVVGSIDSIFKRIAHPGDQVVMLTPIYNVFYNCIRNNKLICKSCDFLLITNRYEIDWDKLESILKEEETKVFLLCNPHNPVGRKFSGEELEKLINLCIRYDVYLVSDEIHADLDYNKERYTSLFNVSGHAYDKAILLLSPGKVFNVAGLQSSVVVIPNSELKELIQNGLWEDDTGEPNYFAIDPVIAAYSYGEEYVYQLNKYLYENREFLMEFLYKNAKNLQILSGNFTYLVWIDISYFNLKSEVFCKLLQERTGLILSPGKIYGESGDHYVRLNIATPRNNLIDACNRLKTFIELLGEK